MRNYLVIFKGAIGCDYSIGCGIRASTYTAENLEDLLDQIHNNCSGREEHEKYGEDLRDYMSGDGCFNLVQVYKIQDEIGNVVDELRKRIEGDKKLEDKKRESEREKEREEIDRKEYERLRKKYDK